MKKYLFDRKTALSDLIAGITLGIESIPDGMASGVLATVNPIHGIYAYMVGTFTGALVTNSVLMSVQAPSAMALIVASVPQLRGGGDDSLQSLVALTVLTGIFVALMGVFNFGRFLRFVSHSVMTGFITGVGVLTILGQLDNITRYTSTGPNRIFKTLDLIFHLNQVDVRTLFVGIVTIYLIIQLEKTRLKSLGLVVAIFVASLLPAVFNWDIKLVHEIAEIPNYLPWPILPSLSLFPAMIVPAISLSLVAMVQGSAVSKSYQNPDGSYPDVDKDFIGQGIANIATGVFQGIPVCGSFSATSLSVNSGARTRFANLSAGITMAIILLLFGSAIGFLAMPSLAGLLMVVGYRIIKLDNVRLVWKIGTIQQATMLITFVLTLLIPLQYAVINGVALSIVLFITRQSNRIRIMEWVRQPVGLPIEQDPPSIVSPEKILVLIPYGSLFFAAADAFEKELPKITEETYHSVVILNLRQRSELGSTFLGVLKRYASELQKHQSRLVLVEVGEETMAQFEKTGYLDIFGFDNIFPSTERVFHSIREAQHEAGKWIKEQQKLERK